LPCLCLPPATARQATECYGYDKSEVSIQLNGSRPQPTLEEVREERRLIRARINLARLNREKKILESLSLYGDGWGTYVNLWDRYRDDSERGYTFSSVNDRRLGRHYPFFSNEQELAMLRAPARILCGTNSYAIGLLCGLTSYVVGTGYNYTVVPHDRADKRLVTSAQDVIDEFIDRTEWDDLEQELFQRWREDGEYLLRHHLDDDGLTDVRTVEPEQMIRPPGESEEWSFGVLHDRGDVQRILRYYFCYMDDPGQGEEVDVRRVIHCKANVKRSIKRGMTDFAFSTRDALDVADRLRRAVGESSAVQAAIAEIVQYENASRSQVQALVDQQADTVRMDPFTGRQTQRERIEPGTRRHIPQGMAWVPPPGAGNGNIQAYIEALQACLRGAGVRWNAPEWLGSSDASNNNFASSLTAESPFVISVKRAQNTLRRRFVGTMKIVLSDAARAGRLPQNILDLVEVSADAPPIETRDPLKEAQTDAVYVGLGAKSVQGVSRELGEDPEQVAQERQEWIERFGPEGPALPMPGDEGGSPPGSPFDFPRGGGGVLLDVPDVRQVTGYSCGRAAVVAVARFLGVELSAGQLSALGTSPQEGTRPANIVALLNSAGLQATSRDGMNLADLEQELAGGRPVLCPIQADDSGDGGHYVVVIGCDGSRLTLQDPVRGRVEMQADEFDRRWYDRAGGQEYRHYGIAVGGQP
jgi:predicted double-glycine peptidase